MNVSIPDNNISKREISIKQFIKPSNDFEDLKLTITASSPVSIKGLKMLFFRREVIQFLVNLVQIV